MKKTRLILCLYLVCLGSLHASIVQVLHPLNGWALEDVGVSFKWYTQPSVLSYKLQVAKDINFTTLVIDTLTDSPNQINDDVMSATTKATFSNCLQWSFLSMTRLLPGTYYWRIRTGDTSNTDWSVTNQFTVVSNSALTPSVQPISKDNPLFTLDMWHVERDCGTTLQLWPKIWGYIPTDIRPYVVLNVAGMDNWGNYAGQADFIDFISRLNALGINMTIETGGPDKPVQNYLDLTQIEYCLKNFSHVRGVVAGETTWSYGNRGKMEAEYYNRCIMLCGKYGKVFIEGVFNDFQNWNWDDLLGVQKTGRTITGRMNAAFINKYKSYYIPCNKDNTQYSQEEEIALMTGAKISGLVDNIGSWHENYWWGKVGYDTIFQAPTQNTNAGNGGYMPQLFLNQTFITGLQSGASVFVFGGEISCVSPNTYNATTDMMSGLSNYTAIFDRYGTKTPVLDKYFIPFVRYVVTNKMVLSKVDLLSNIKVAVDQTSAGITRGSTFDNGIFAQLFKSTYTIPNWISNVQSKSLFALKPVSGTTGRIVKLQRTGTSIGLNVAEVKVFSNGVNIATSGTATQSTMLSTTTAASKAIDGNTNGVLTNNSVACTLSTDTNPWWQLDLGVDKKIDSIVVYSVMDRNQPDLSDIQNVNISLTTNSGQSVYTSGNYVSTLGPNPYQLFPKNGKYNAIAVLPNGSSVAGVPGITTVSIANLQTDAAVKAVYDANYSSFYTGDAAVFRNTNKYFILNSLENENRSQTFSIPFSNGSITNISGTMVPHSYIISSISTDGNTYSFQACTNTTGPYTDDRTTNLVISLTQMPTVTVSPASALVTNTWNATAKTLSLKINHVLGAANVVVSTSITTINDVMSHSNATVFGIKRAIHVNAPSGSFVLVYAISGQLIKSVTINSDQFTIPISRGIYVVSVAGVRQKVIVN